RSEARCTLQGPLGTTTNRSRTMSLRQSALLRLFVTSLVLLVSTETRAIIVFGTQFTNPGTLVRIDTVSGQFTVIHATGNSPDSLVFDPSGRMIYTLFGANELRRFDPEANTDGLI